MNKQIHPWSLEDVRKLNGKWHPIGIKDKKGGKIKSLMLLFHPVTGSTAQCSTAKARFNYEMLILLVSLHKVKLIAQWKLCNVGESYHVKLFFLFLPSGSQFTVHPPVFPSSVISCTLLRKTSSMLVHFVPRPETLFPVPAAGVRPQPIPPRTFFIRVEGDCFRCIPSFFLLPDVALDGRACERPLDVQCHSVAYISVRTQRWKKEGWGGEPAHASVINASCIATSRKIILLYVPCEEQGAK